MGGASSILFSADRSAKAHSADGAQGSEASECDGL